jgi:hypothetical protein
MAYQDHYVLNQLAIQIGWLMGYFSHLENNTPENASYLKFGMPLLTMYQEHVYQLMHAFAEAHNEAEQSHITEAESSINNIRYLSEKAYSHKLPAVSQFQKEILLAHASIEKTIIELITEGYEMKIILISLFYFWFTLEAPLNGASKQALDNTNPFEHMPSIIDLVKTTTHPLPEPEFNKDIHALNDAMQQLKKHITHPEILDNPSTDIVQEQTGLVNTAIHTSTCDLLKQDINIQAVANALFSLWLRFSVFFGVTEQQWQKMDFYLPEIIKEVRSYLVFELVQ